MRRAIAVTVFLLVPSVSIHAQAPNISKQEIQDSWVGRTLLGTTAGGAAATLKLNADGSATVSAGSINDTGTWHLSEQGYCTTWKTIRGGQERCFTVRREGTKMVVLNPDGTVNGHFTEIK